MISREELQVGIRVKTVDTYRNAVNEYGECVYLKPEELDEIFTEFLGSIVTVNDVYGNWFRVEENDVEWNICDISYIVEDEVELGQPNMSDLNKMLF